MSELDSTIFDNDALGRYASHDGETERPADGLALPLATWEQLTDSLTILTDERGSILHVSRNSLAYLGVDAEELIGTSLQRLESRQEQRPSQGRVQSLLEQITLQRSVDSFLLTLVDRDGKQCELIFHGLLLSGEADGRPRMLLAGRDATNSMVHQSSDASAALAELHGVASQTAHRFNNLLTALSYQIASIETGQEDRSTLRDNLHEAYIELKKQSHLLSQMCANLKPSQ